MCIEPGNAPIYICLFVATLNDLLAWRRCFDPYCQLSILSPYNDGDRWVNVQRTSWFQCPEYNTILDFEAFNLSAFLLSGSLPTERGHVEDGIRKVGESMLGESNLHFRECFSGTSF